MKTQTNNAVPPVPLARLVRPLGAQLMAMKPEKRRCPQCLGALTYPSGCGGRKVPSCETCKGFMPRGGAGYWIITTDENGIVNGTMEPEVIEGKAYWPNVTVEGPAGSATPNKNQPA